jgi:hypothetical protein
VFNDTYVNCIGNGTTEWEITWELQMLSMSNVNGSSHDLFQGTNLEFIWWDWGKILKSVSVAGGLHTEIEQVPSKYEAAYSFIIWNQLK